MPQLCSTSHLVALPSRARLIVEVTYHLGEAVLIPLGLFYVVVVGFGLNSALWAALAWSFFAVGVRIVTHGRAPVLLVVATAISVLKVVITYLSNSATTYFIQPTVFTFAFAVA